MYKILLLLSLALSASHALSDELDTLKRQLLESQKQTAQYKTEVINIRSSILGLIGNKKTVKTDDLRAIIEPFTSSENPDCRLSGKVIKLADGDTITVLDSNREQHKIRLSGIDAPERGQPYGTAAKKFLSNLVFKKVVCVQWHKKDKYGRLVGLVFIDEKDVNLQLVKAGYAWHFKKYQGEQTASDREIYSIAEAQAKSDVIGLWSEPDPINPDDWRAGVRQKKKTPLTKQSIPTASNFSCGAKRFCKKMTSCNEACFYLTECGLSRLDRDDDGIPCESLCSQQCSN